MTERLAVIVGAVQERATIHEPRMDVVVIRVFVKNSRMATFAIHEWGYEYTNGGVRDDR
jgi:hypothetical protein